MSDVGEMFRPDSSQMEILPHAHQWEEAGEFPRELYAKAAEVGILGAGYPEAYGGSGGDRLFPLIAAKVLGVEAQGLSLVFSHTALHYLVFLFWELRLETAICTAHYAG